MGFCDMILHTHRSLQYCGPYPQCTSELRVTCKLMDESNLKGNRESQTPCYDSTLSSGRMVAILV
jgi:hypothetical protein